mgnify:FL=1
MVIVLYIVLLVNSLATVDPRQRFPVGGQGDLVDKRWLITDNMVTKRKAEREKTERYSARGTGKQMLKILYQNGGNVTHTYNMIGDIETMLNANRPHVFMMAENRLDLQTKNRLENCHGFCVEELGDRERIWGAVRSTVPYKRRKDLQ